MVPKLLKTNIQATNAIFAQDKPAGALTASGFSVTMAGAWTSGPKAMGTLGSVGKAVAGSLPGLNLAITAGSLGKDWFDADANYKACNKAH